MPEFGKVVGQFKTIVVDSDDPDSIPDIQSLNGTIEFTLNVAKLIDASETPNPVTYGASKFIGVLDSDGYLSTPNAAGSGILYPGLWMLATDDPDMNPHINVSYTVVYKLKDAKGVLINLPSHTLAVPANSTVDLSLAIPPDGAPVEGVAAAEAAAQLAIQAANSAVKTVNNIGPDADGNVDVAGGGGSGIQSVVAGTNITVDNTDPNNPVISATGGGTTDAVWGSITGDILDQTDLQDALDGFVSDDELANAIAGITLASLGGVPATRTIAGHALTSDIALGKSDVGLGNVDNTSDASKPVSTAQAAAIAAKLDASQKGAASGVATLDGSSKIPVTQIPDIAIVNYLGTVASQTAMLALVGQQGDWAIRSDLGTVWTITGSDPTQIGNWVQMSYPTAPVSSVAGKTGAVTLGASDVGAVPTTRQVNGKALSADITLAASDVSAVPTTRTVNSKPLSANIVLAASDVSAVPTARTVNGKALSSNITLAASDVAAIPTSDGISHILPITTAAYTALGTKDSATLYLITDAS